MSMPISHLQAIQHKLQRLLMRFYLVLLWHCLLIYGLLIWLAFIGQLILGQTMWPLLWWGSLIPAGYAGYRITKRPSLSQIACLADQRCQLQSELITAWQYRHSEQPVLPLLLTQVAGDLGKIKPSLIFSFKLSRWCWVVVVVLLGGSWYFSHYPPRLPSPQENVQPTKGNQLSVLANQLKEVSQELDQIAPGEELPQLISTTERLQQLAQELEDSAAESQVIVQLQELKQELTQSLPAEAALPEMPQGTEIDNKPALLEIEITSDRLRGLIYKLMQQGFSSKQIQNRILRELVSLMDHLIQFKLPVKGSKPDGAGAQLAKAEAGLSHAGKGRPKAPIPRILGATGTRVSGYGERDSQGYQQQGIDQSSLSPYWSSPQAEPGELTPKVRYSYLPSRYQQRVYSVLADQQIPLHYRRQVRGYFDALSN